MNTVKSIPAAMPVPKQSGQSSQATGLQITTNKSHGGTFETQEHQYPVCKDEDELREIANYLAHHASNLKQMSRKSKRRFGRRRKHEKSGPFGAEQSLKQVAQQLDNLAKRIVMMPCGSIFFVNTPQDNAHAVCTEARGHSNLHSAKVRVNSTEITVEWPNHEREED